MQTPNHLPSLTLDDFEGRFRDRHLLHGIVEKWACEKPSAAALIDSDRGRSVTWEALDRMSSAVATRLLDAGFTKGDCFASFLPLTSEHLFLEFACFKIGVVFVPLDLRLPPAELLRCMKLVDAKGFAFARIPGVTDSATFIQQLRASFDFKLLVQFSDASECEQGVIPIAALLGDSEAGGGAALGKHYAALTESVAENDPALVIFTTGSTGSPKPALLSHRNISCQAMCISQTLFQMKTRLITLVNLPASHVGCQTELLMGTLFDGGTAVLVPVFDPLRSLRAVHEHKVTVIGQIPAMFQFEWRLKDYESVDLSSLEFAAYGGQQVSEAFIAKLSSMAPHVGSGLGLTETAGFCTYIRVPRERGNECTSSLGIAMPVYPMTIREPMRSDGSAGEELPDGELGHVCFRGPQTFLGYLGDPQSTAATISSDDYLYTGDLGFLAPDGLHLAGRAKFVIKSAGYQVFPGDVENHFCALEPVASCAVVGVEHTVLSEAIVAFIERKAGSELNTQSLEKHGRGLASYMRPRHYVLLEAGEMPLNRVAKADYMALRERARDEVAKARRPDQRKSAPSDL